MDRHAEQDPNRVALIWEKDEPGSSVNVTYGELTEMTSRLANALRRRGVKAGDVVAIYMPVMPVAVAAMMACARIGAIHSVIFAGFSPEAIASRIQVKQMKIYDFNRFNFFFIICQDSQAVAIITADEAVRGGKKISLKSSVDKALEKCSSIKTCFVAQRTGASLNMVPERDFFLKEVRTT